MMPSKGWLSLDIETSGDPWSGKLVSIAVSDPLDPEVLTVASPEVEGWLLDILADPDVGIIEHTLYDARWLRLAGYDIQGPIADTRVMAWNINENTKLDLESLVMRYLNHPMDKRIRVPGGVVKFKTDEGKFVPIEEAPWDELARYNRDDAHETAELFTHLLPLQPEGWEDQVRLTSVLLDMECNGMPIDIDSMAWMRETYGDTLVQIKDELTKELPPAFNLGSDDQVAAYLFLKEFKLPARVRRDEPMPKDFVLDKEARVYSHGHYVVEGLGLKPGKWTEKGKRPKTDAKTLAVLYGAHPWVSRYLEYQKIDKLMGTYLEGLPRFVHEGRLYGTFNQAGTVTGRLSSSDPNLQNLPRRGRYGADIRGLFVGDLIVADFSQLEPRIQAHCSGDKALRDIFTQGLDIYRRTAQAVFGVHYGLVNDRQREICKQLILSMGYGAKSRKIAEILSIAGFPTTSKQAKAYLDAVTEAYARFFEWREEVAELSHQTGYVTTLGGRIRHIGYAGAESVWKAERQAVNSIIQGSAADIVNATTLQVAEIPDISILCQVHDELVLQYHTEPAPLEKIQYAGEHGHGFKLEVPLVFEPILVRSWGEK